MWKTRPLIQIVRQVGDTLPRKENSVVQMTSWNQRHEVLTVLAVIESHFYIYQTLQLSFSPLAINKGDI